MGYTFRWLRPAKDSSVAVTSLVIGARHECTVEIWCRCAAYLGDELGVADGEALFLIHIPNEVTLQGVDQLYNGLLMTQWTQAREGLFVGLA